MRTTHTICIVLLLSLLSQVAAAASYGPFEGWTARGYHDAGLVLWQHDNGRASLWTLLNGEYATHVEYGPYGGWTAQDAGPGYLLWSHRDGAASVWTLDGVNRYRNHRYYGPYAGWSAVSYTTVPVGGARMLWANADGTASLWRLDAAGNYASHRSYGPWPGWTPVTYSERGNGQGELVWAHVDGTVNTWLLDASGTYRSHRSERRPEGALLSDHQSRDDETGRRLWAFEDGSARVDVVPLPYRDVFDRIQMAYQNGDAEFYDEQLRHLGRNVRRMQPVQCAQAERAAIELGCREGFDGLEPVVLSLHDCAATPIETGELYEQTYENGWMLGACLRYDASARETMPGMVSSYNSRTGRAVPGAILRRVLGHLARQPLQRRPWTNLRDLLGSPTLNRELCALPPRSDALGLPVLQDLIRMAECRTGTATGSSTARFEMCTQVVNATTDAQLRPTTAARNPGDAVTRSGGTAGVRELSSHEIERLGRYCLSSPASPAAGNGDPLSSHSAQACGETDANPEVMASGDLAEMIQGCLGDPLDGGANPLAANGTDGCLGHCAKHYPMDQLELERTNRFVSHHDRNEPGANAFMLGVLIRDFIARLLDDAEEEREAAKDTAEEEGTSQNDDDDRDNAGDDDDGLNDERDRVEGPVRPESAGLNPEFGGGVDMTNPACQDLARTGLLNGHRGDFWDTFFERAPGRDPRRELPNPADEGSDRAQRDGEACDGPSPTATAHCPWLVLCHEGTVADESCRCVRPDAGAVSGLCPSGERA